MHLEYFRIIMNHLSIHIYIIFMYIYIYMIYTYAVIWHHISQAMRLWQTFDANADGGISREAKTDHIHQRLQGILMIR